MAKVLFERGKNSRTIDLGECPKYRSLFRSVNEPLTEQLDIDISSLESGVIALRRSCGTHLTGVTFKDSQGNVVGRGYVGRDIGVEIYPGCMAEVDSYSPLRISFVE